VNGKNHKRKLLCQIRPTARPRTISNRGRGGSTVDRRPREQGGHGELAAYQRFTCASGGGTTITLIRISRFSHGVGSGADPLVHERNLEGRAAGSRGQERAAAGSGRRQQAAGPAA
jgi:hypothetical protein